jgi:ribosomal protein L36
MKKSKLQRKYINSMRSMADVPWPARRFKYPPMARRATRLVEVGTCERKVDEAKVKTSRFKRAKTEDVLCGGRLLAKLAKRSGKRRVYCENCRARARQRKFELRIRMQIQNRLGIVQHAPSEERRSSRLLNRLRRTGAR